MNRNNVFKRIFTGWLIIGLLALVAACGSKTDTETAGKLETFDLKIADIASNTVFRVAKSKGIFEKHGIRAELINFATPAEGINSLFIKQTDIAWGADFPILNAVSKGEYSIIASTGTGTDESAKQWKLYTNKSIHSAADLKGKTLSTLRGTFIPYLWDEYLSENGIGLQEVELLGQGGLDETYVALKKGEIDAAWITGAAILAKFEELDNVHVLADMSQSNVRLGSDIIAGNSLIEEHPKVIVQFLQSLEEATQYAQDHPDETADILFKEVKQPREATLKDLAVQKWTIGFDQTAFESLRKQKEYMIKSGIIQQDFELKDKLKLDAIRESFPTRVID